MSRPGWLSPAMAPVSDRTLPAKIGHLVLVHLPVLCLPMCVPERSCSDKLSQLVPNLLIPWAVHGSRQNVRGPEQTQDSTDVRGISGQEHHRRSVGRCRNQGGRRGWIGCSFESAGWPDRRYGSDILSRHATPILHPRAPTAGRVEMCVRLARRFCSLRLKRHEQAGVGAPTQN
jgi:hypothetical protein